MLDETKTLTCNDCANFDGVICDFNGLRRYPDDDPMYGCKWKGFVLDSNLKRYVNYGKDNYRT